MKESEFWMSAFLAALTGTAAGCNPETAVRFARETADLAVKERDKYLAVKMPARL